MAGALLPLCSLFWGFAALPVLRCGSGDVTLKNQVSSHETAYGARSSREGACLPHNDMFPPKPRGPLEAMS